jgi:hypothetical protein
VLEKFPGFEPPVARLFGLANTPFEPQPFRRACEEFASFDARSSDDDLWFFAVNGGPRLIVGLETQVIGRRPNGRPELRQLAVSCAILSVCWWETFMQSQHESWESWAAEHAEFDRLFSDRLADAVALLGPPRVQGSDEGEYPHRYAVWRGETGLLVLQQSTYDLQFGLDVNYWVQPWSGPDPRPTSPFIDWLIQLSSSKG